MKHFTELTATKLEELNVPVILSKKRNNKVDYLNIAAGFDIETSSEYQRGEKVAHMYIWMFGIGHNQPVYYGRTWEEFLETTNLLEETFDLRIDRRLVIYVHNLSYEFQFMKHLFQWESIFAMSKGSVLKAVTTGGIEFRCSMKLSASSLANVARNLSGKYACKKMEGDLDYSLIRHYNTPLTPEEMGYCENDIVVVVNYISKEIELAKGITNIEMTNTGRVRTRIKKAFRWGGADSAREASAGVAQRSAELINSMTMDAELYQQCKNTFQGGFTHSNPKKTWATYNDVSSYDLTSSYPTVMCAEQFPMSTPVKVNMKTAEELKELMIDHCVMFRAHFKGLRNKLGFESYFSVHKGMIKGNHIESNGRIFEADELMTYMTDIDFIIAQHVYDWDSVEFTRVYKFKKHYLPRAIIMEILSMYSDKTTLKGVEGREDDYMLSKGMLNSTYGMCVTDPVKDEHTFDGEEWVCEKANVSEKLEGYNKSRSRSLYYPWGVWVTAYARRNLWSAILNIKDDYIYADTDSVKFLNHEKHKPYFAHYNKQITGKLTRMCEYLDIDKGLLMPRTIKGEDAPLGIWDYEGTYSHFKTLGAKRYLVKKGDKYQITVAGLSKQNGLEYIKELAGDSTDAIFGLFNDGLFIPADKTGKMTHTAIDSAKMFPCTDYRGEVAEVMVACGMHLEPASFDMGMTDNFKWFLETQADGYTYTGDTISL